MDEATRARIRHLYFVERMPLPTIAETLTLASHAVRAALVLSGGRTERREPEPVATAVVSVARRHVTQRHR